MCEKFVLSPKEGLEYEIMFTKLDEVGGGGGLLKGGDNRCKKRNWIGLLEENKAFLFMVCHVSSTFRPKCNNDVQHFYHNLSLGLATKARACKGVGQN